MKKFFAVCGLATVLSTGAMAASWVGYIVDESCSTKKEMWSNEKCATACIGRGQKAVFVTEEGKVFKVAEQDKVKAHAGHKVTVTGTMDGDTIKVESVKM